MSWLNKTTDNHLFLSELNVAELFDPKSCRLTKVEHKHKDIRGDTNGMHRVLNNKENPLAILDLSVKSGSDQPKDQTLFPKVGSSLLSTAIKHQ